MATSQGTPPLLDAQKLLIIDPPYTEYSLANLDKADILRLEYFRGSVDAYCVECKERSIFESEAQFPNIRVQGMPFHMRRIEDVISHTEEEEARKDRVFVLELSCTRIREHHIWFCFLVKGNRLIKIGQHPSLADFQLRGLSKYDAALTKDQRKDFARAIGLHAHGVGVGAFVYLRRIFEDLIKNAHNKALIQSSWQEEVYHSSRVQEKIQLLAHFLPEVLVNNASMYSILSKGIHSLTEQDCLNYFDTVKLGIELILDEEIEIREKEKKKAALMSEVTRIKGELK